MAQPLTLTLDFPGIFAGASYDCVRINAMI